MEQKAKIFGSLGLNFSAVLFVLVPLYVDGTEGKIFRSLEVELYLLCRDWASVFINGQRLRRN